MKYKQVIYSLSLLFLIAGCTHHYVPDPETFELDSTIEFTSTNSVSLVNGQESTENELIATNMGHEFFGNLQTWTETAMTITQNELTDRGMSITRDAPRKLIMSIESAHATFGAWVIRGEVFLKVETGNGYIETYKGDNRSPATLYRALDGAVMRAVAEMLKDEKITDYLIE